MRYIFLTILSLTAFASMAQEESCYDNLFEKGKKLYDVANYEKALVKWEAALTCDLTYAQRQTLNEWIAKAKNSTPSVSSTPTTLSYEPEMVFVEGGTFKMGNNQGVSDEKPTHSVTLIPFYIGKYEITQKQWREVMGSNPPELNFKGCDNCPVERVSWNDIQDFLQKLNAKIIGKKYRLPTEAEWEYAARGGNKSKGYKYSGSNTIENVAWYDKNADSKTNTVGTKQANELGIYDMSGNVTEWCSDWYGFYSSSLVTNPKGASLGDYRVFRGGSGRDVSSYCQVSYRGFSIPSYRYNYVGFRVVRYE
jgi:formylglycine-generating enzyme required for sulfatase activity